MYTSFFNLRKKPFELVPDPDFIYLSRSHRKALTYLDYGIRERAGFILLTGEVGSGKTTLIRDLLKKKYDRVVLSKVFNTRVSSEQLLAMINDDFGLPAAGKDKISLMRDLNDFLLEQYAQGKHPILIIDEAQNLAADLLEEIRMLSNLECSQAKLLQIVLVGQPELRATLSGADLLQLRQRISINCHLKALCREETAEYIAHRMNVAGNANAVEFPPDTVDLIHKCSRGIPRLINIICDFLMLSAFAEERRSVPLEMVREIMGDLDFENHYWGCECSALTRDKSRDTGTESWEPSQEIIDLAQRVETVEKEFSLRVPAALREISETLARLQEEFGARIGRWESVIEDLSGKLALVSGESERRGMPPLAPMAGGTGLVRRLLGGANPHRT